MKPGVQTTIDEFGCLILPERLRELAGIVPGSPLVLTFDDGAIRVTPAPCDVLIAPNGLFLVAERATDGAPLTLDLVQDTVASIRSRPATLPHISMDQSETQITLAPDSLERRN